MSAETDPTFALSGLTSAPEMQSNQTLTKERAAAFRCPCLNTRKPRGEVSEAGHLPSCSPAGMSVSPHLTPAISVTPRLSLGSVMGPHQCLANML